MKLKNNDSQTEGIKSQKINYWKWAFLSLILILLVLFIIIVNALKPVSTIDIVAEPIQEEEVLTLTTTMHTDDVEWLANTYLQQTLGEEFANYSITLSNVLEVHGEIEVLRFEIPFALYFEPFVLENGNLQLRGKSVELSNFSLPVNTVMRLMANQLAIPNFLTINSEKQLINVNLDELTEDYSFDVSMTKIDLQTNEIILDLYLDEESVYENIQFLGNPD